MLRTGLIWVQRVIRKARKRRRKRRKNIRNIRRRKTKNTKERLKAPPHPLLLGPGTRDMILTPPPAVREGSGDIARTVKEAHPTDGRTEALMTEYVGDILRMTELWLPQLGH